MIETTIWLNVPESPFEPSSWRIVQRRIVPTANGPIFAYSFRPEDLDAARWGLYQARRWVKKAERRGSIRALFVR
jgi:hypothetical protein